MVTIIIQKMMLEWGRGGAVVRSLLGLWAEQSHMTVLERSHIHSPNKYSYLQLVMKSLGFQVIQI